MTKDRATRKATLYREWADKAEANAARLHDEFYMQYGDFLALGEPIKIGHHSQRRHERLYERQENMLRTVVELQDKAKLYRQRADNLELFANTNKGDAERKRQAKRNESDERVKIGDLIDTVLYGLRELIKINKKTYTIKFPDGRTTTIDKSFIRF
jgi:hypothetical protein